MGRFMNGRYGGDQFNQFLIIVALITTILATFTGKSLNILALVILGYSYFRMMSKNHYKRIEENQMYLEYAQKIKSIFRKEKSIMEQKKDYRIYKCPSCKQKVRVPKGKGKVEVSCPKCKTTFVKKS